MAYKVIILYQLYMPSYFLGTFTEYPYLIYLYGLNNSTNTTLTLYLTAEYLFVILLALQSIVYLKKKHY